MNDTQALIAVGIMAFVTAFLRFIPFLVFGKRKTPAFIEYLGKVLPYAAMGMLVVYCLKDMSVAKPPFAIPEILSVLLVVVLHVWKRSTLLSIISGTVCYMVLIRLMQ